LDFVFHKCPHKSFVAVGKEDRPEESGQGGVTTDIASLALEVAKRNTVALAKAAKLLAVPAIVTTGTEDKFQGLVDHRGLTFPHERINMQLCVPRLTFPMSFTVRSRPALP
jgi:hypothetical protein